MLTNDEIDEIISWFWAMWQEFSVTGGIGKEERALLDKLEAMRPLVDAPDHWFERGFTGKENIDRKRADDANE